MILSHAWRRINCNYDVFILIHRVTTALLQIFIAELRNIHADMTTARDKPILKSTGKPIFGVAGIFAPRRKSGLLLD
jgi:hypothetical protein